jgi:hypothetical protein
MSAVVCVCVCVCVCVRVCVCGGGGGGGGGAGKWVHARVSECLVRVHVGEHVVEQVSAHVR